MQFEDNWSVAQAKQASYGIPNPGARSKK